MNRRGFAAGEAPSTGFLRIASAAETFAQLAPRAATHRLVGDQKLRFTVAAEAFLTGFHRTITGSNGHGTKLDAIATLLTEIGAYAEGVVHVTVPPPSHKANGPGFPDLGANTHTTSTQNTVLIPKRIADLLDPTAHGDVLNSTGVRGLSHQQLCEVAAQFADLVCISHYHHALFHVQGARSGDLGTAVDHVFDNAKPACADVGQIGNMAQMGNTDAVLDCSVEHAVPLGRANDGSINANVDILQHITTPFSQKPRIASELHSLWQIPHF